MPIPQQPMLLVLSMWVLQCVCPLTLPCCLRSGVWEHVMLRLHSAPNWWDFLVRDVPLYVCVHVLSLRCGGFEREVYEVCGGGGGADLLLVAWETPSSCGCCCTPQTMAALLSILSERPRRRFPPSANKGPGQPALALPPSSPYCRAEPAN